MDLLLVVLVAALVVFAAGWVSMWAIFLGLVAVFGALGVVAFPFLRIRDPRRWGRSLKREVLLSTLPKA